jgi:hypothetical protein
MSGWCGKVNTCTTGSCAGDTEGVSFPRQMTFTQKSPARLREVREAQGRSLRSVAKEAGMDPASLSRVERGLQRPSVGLADADRQGIGASEPDGHPGPLPGAPE